MKSFKAKHLKVSARGVSRKTTTTKVAGVADDTDAKPPSDPPKRGPGRPRKDS